MLSDMFDCPDCLEKSEVFELDKNTIKILPRHDPNCPSPQEYYAIYMPRTVEDNDPVLRRLDDYATRDHSPVNWSSEYLAWMERFNEHSSKNELKVDKDAGPEEAAAKIADHMAKLLAAIPSPLDSPWL